MTRYSASRGIMYTTPPDAEEKSTTEVTAERTADGDDPAAADD